MKFAALFLSALVATSYAAAAPTRDPYGLGFAHPQKCATGYHVDAGGNCQPNIAQTNPYCDPGLVYQPFPDGWLCVLPPKEAY